MTAPVGCLDGESPKPGDTLTFSANGESFTEVIGTFNKGGELWAPTTYKRTLPLMSAMVREIYRLRAALSASRQEGWQLVPVEPTKEMIEAAGATPGMRAIDSASATHQLRGNPLPAAAFADGSPLHQAYRAMLAAAPHQSQEAQGDRHGE